MNTPSVEHLSNSQFLYLLALLLCAALVGCSESGSSSAFNSTAGSPLLPEPSHATNSDNGDSPNTLRGTLDITISWIPPSTREDGTPLQVTDIWGYEILTVQNNAAISSVTISSTDLTEYTFPKIPAADYSFSIYTYDVNAAVSTASAAVTLTTNQFPLL